VLTAEQIIRLLGLAPLPVEGGHFRQTYRSEEMIEASALPARYPSDKSFCTAIYYLLTSEPDSFSAMHRLPTEEIYHFYLGDPVEMLLLHPEGKQETLLLGPDIANGQRLQHVVRRETWQGSRLRPGGRFALLGTTMAPGFDAEDFFLGDREDLMRTYPQSSDLIRKLTRNP